MKHIRLLDTTIESLTAADLSSRLVAAVDRPSGPALFIVTANPEILLHAHRDRAYRETLARSSLRLADGFGIVAVAWLLQESVRRVTGGELLRDILALADARSLHVHATLRPDGLTAPERFVAAVAVRYPRVRSSAAYADPLAAPSAGTGADILLVGFGAPDQERWIDRYGTAFPRARIMLGVGGALDVLAGTVPAAPAAMRALGLEWLWRLVIQPRRFPRMVRAVVVFPLTVAFHRWLHRRPVASSQ